MGDSAASLMTCEPLLMRPQWGAFGKAKEALSMSFVWGNLSFNPISALTHATLAAICQFPETRKLAATMMQEAQDIAGKLGLAKTVAPVKGTRSLTKAHMLHNDLCPEITVNPETFEVFVDGELATCEPAETLPLTQRYMMR